MLPGQKIPVLRIIFICFLVKVLLAASTELNNDEVYYWTYAQKLQWSYFDHPPVIAVLIKIFTVNLRFDSELMIRLGAIICSAICCWIIYHIGRLIKDEQTGLFSALLFVASPYSNIIAGFLIIPDAPQLMFWLWSVLLMIKITNSDPGDQRTSQLLLMLGLSIGLLYPE
jgi:4-amino-4-deoxy-L-arabinose transferase-like glycosyltransferase